MTIINFVNSIFSSNSFLVYGVRERECCLIDCGDVTPILDYMEQHHLMLKAVFLTHTHFDHIYGLNRLVGQIPDISVYTSAFGKSALLSAKLNLSRYHPEPFVFLYADRVRVLTENEAVCLGGNIPVETFFTPGHDKSCLTYKIDGNIFSGDSFIPGMKVVASFPNSNKTEAKYSEQRIREKADGCNLYPGHGRCYIPYHLESI